MNYEHTLYQLKEGLEKNLSNIDFKATPLIYTIKVYKESFIKFGISASTTEAIISHMTIDLPIFELTEKSKLYILEISEMTAQTIISFKDSLEEEGIENVDSFLINFASKISLSIT